LIPEISLRVTRRAHAHIRRAAEWWELNRPLAPGAVHEELDQAFALLRSQPRIGAIAMNARTRGVRRIHLERIHYFLYYRVRGSTVQVLALWHTSRGRDPRV
jgi:plasmid stabilization system protein ParE